MALVVSVEAQINLVIPGFVPSPLGEIVEYVATAVELAVTAGIWGLGLFVLTVLVKVALPIELGEVRSPYLKPDAPLDGTAVRPIPPEAFPVAVGQEVGAGSGADRP